MKLSFFMAALSLGIVTSTPDANAAGSVQNAIAASKHATQAIGEGIAASGQATMGVLAIPLLSIGVVGSAVAGASTAAGNAAAAAATGIPVSGPLPIADETITVFSPAEALKKKTTNAPR